jgi:hypothetical protein
MFGRYGIVDQNVLTTTTTSTTTIWKGDVSTSVSGNGISVTFTGNSFVPLPPFHNLRGKERGKGREEDISYLMFLLDVDTLTPHKVSHYQPGTTPLTPGHTHPVLGGAARNSRAFEEPVILDSRFEDPMQNDGLVMKEARPSWSGIF